MCRYAMVPYKEHYACFKCRKAYKKPPLSDLPQQPKEGEERIVLCPQCREPMHNLGHDFKAPAQDNVKQWKKAERLFELGITFHSCGCCGPGLRPATLRDIEPFLEEQRSVKEERTRAQAVAKRAAELKTKRKKATLKRLEKAHLKALKAEISSQK
jgi:hypothetical protein